MRTSSERQALDLILAAFPGSRIFMDLSPIPTRKPKKYIMDRARVRASVRACTACGLVDRCSGPVPLSAPLRPRRAAWRAPDGTLDLRSTAVPSMSVVGEAPGDREDRLEEPFIGRSGQLLRKLFREAGLDDEDAAWMNVVSCFPNGKVKQRKPDKPTMEEMWRCRTNLLSQLQAVGSRHVLLVGATALSSFRDDLQITKVHGRVFSWLDRYVVMSIQHPASALRKGSATVKNEILSDLMFWKGIVSEEVAPGSVVDHRCVWCSAHAVVVDMDHVGYCETHRRMNEGQDEWNRSKWEGSGCPPARRPRQVKNSGGRSGRTGTTGPGLPGI